MPENDATIDQITPAEYDNPALRTLVHQYRSGVDKAPSEFKQKLDWAVAVGEITGYEAAAALRNESAWRAPTEWVDERGESVIEEAPSATPETAPPPERTAAPGDPDANILTSDKAAGGVDK